jgi:hypothetical protein
MALCAIDGFQKIREKTADQESLSEVLDVLGKLRRSAHYMEYGTIVERLDSIRTLIDKYIDQKGGLKQADVGFDRHGSADHVHVQAHLGLAFKTLHDPLNAHERARQNPHAVSRPEGRARAQPGIHRQRLADLRQHGADFLVKRVVVDQARDGPLAMIDLVRRRGALPSILYS